MFPAYTTLWAVGVPAHIMQAFLRNLRQEQRLQIKKYGMVYGDEVLIGGRSEELVYLISTSRKWTDGHH